MKRYFYKEMLFSLCVFYLFTVLSANVHQFSKSVNLPPVVIIPGDGGSMLEAKVNIETLKNADCPKHKDWFRIWLNLQELLPFTLPCQVEILKLFFNNQTNTSYSSQGIDIRVPGFGNTHSVEYIDDSWAAFLLGDIGAYAHQLVVALSSYGLVRNVSIRGAPYDFRLSMNSHKKYFTDLRQLIENTYTINSNTKVALIAHSLGGLYSTWFLNHQPQAWKDKFINCLITLSSPWGGSTESLQAIVSGFTFHHSTILDPLVTRQEQRTWESNFFLLPNAQLWPEIKYFVLSDERNYTVTRSGIIALLNRLGVPTDIYNYVRDANDPKPTLGGLPPFPGVDIYCVYGTQVKTNQVLDYRGKNFPDDQPDMIGISGDGTAAHASLALCKGWNLKKDQIVEIANASHNEVLQDSEGIDAVIKILMSRI